MSDALAGLSTAKQRLLARMLAGTEAGQSRPSPIPRRPYGTSAPLSPEQMGIWLHAAGAPQDPLYNEPITIRAAGWLDRTIVERSLNAFALRHELWRTSFHVIDGRVLQVVHRDPDIKVAETVLSEGDCLSREQAALRIAAADARMPFDLERAPLIRARLISVTPGDQRLFLTLHHLLFDGISLTRVLLPELAAIYESYRAGQEPPLPSPTLQYGDYAVWRAAPENVTPVESLAWWHEQFSTNLPVLALNSVRATGVASSHAGAMECFTLSPLLSSQVKTFSRDEGVTLYSTLLAAYAVLLCQLSGQNDIPIGGVTETRKRAELETVFGCFLNTVVMRTRPQSDLTFRQFVGAVQEVVLAALEHSDAPFDQIVREVNPKRLGLRRSLFQAMFSIQPPPAVVDGWDLAQMDVSTGCSKFDLYLELEERSDGLLGRFLYATDLFDAPTIRSFTKEWTRILERGVACPEISLAMLMEIDRGGRRSTGEDQESSPETFPDWFQKVASENADAIALEYEGEVVTYRELDERAESLAELLRERGIGPDKLVAVALDRSIELVVWLLAILKAGGAYLPIDPFQPKLRIASILQDATPDLLLLDPRCAEHLPELGLPRLDCRVRSGPTGRVTAHKSAPLKPQGENLAYVIYTSGSTGKPKGVEISHRSLVNLLTAMKSRFALGKTDRAIAINTLSFDFSVAEIFLPLVAGAKLVLAGRDVARDPLNLKALVERTQCSLLQTTPATWRGLIAAGWRGRKGLTLVSGGEVLTPELARRLLEGGSDLWNVYGPTETTVFAIVHRVSADEIDVPIGRPIDGVHSYILDETGGLVDGSEPGELYIGGAGVARGYRNDPALTAKRFVVLPNIGPGRLYRTGDIVRRRENGVYEWLGRTDNQVKVRGFRVGIEEIEAMLQSHPEVAAAAVRAWPDASGGLSLCAYVVHIGNPDLVRFGLRVFLRERFPEHMVPSRFIALDHLPLTSSGKVDRKQLPEPRRNGVQRPIDEPRSALERDLVRIWCTLLGLPRIGIHDNFFDLGGHSVLAFMMIAEVKRLTKGRELALSVLLSNPTVAQLGSVLESEPQPFSHLAPLKPDGKGNPLFIVHGAFGHILVFKRFAEQIRTERPIFAVQASGTDPSAASESTIDEMSNAYLDAIRTVQPQGPYALAGYSFGGLVAYEMARKLQQDGETVEFLGLIDTYVHHRNLPTPERLRYYLSLPVQLAKKLSSLNLRQWPTYLRKRTEVFYRRATLRLRPRGTAQGLSYEWASALPESSARMYEVALREYLSYRLRPFEGIVDFFRASHRSLGECDPVPAWSDAAGRLIVHDVIGNHGTILDENVAGLAEEIGACLEKVDAKPQRASLPQVAARNPRLLVLTMVHWPSTVRLCMALKEAGFDIAAMAPARHGLWSLHVCSQLYPSPATHSAGALLDAVRAWSPDLLIPADERAVRYLHHLYWKADGKSRELLGPLIERSLGPARSFSITACRAAFMAFARRENIPVPETSALAAIRKTRHERSSRLIGPLVLKRDGTSGGEGVRIVHSTAEVDEVVRKLVRPPWFDVAREMLVTRSMWPLRERMHHAEIEIAVQKFVPGTCANRAVVCWEGKVLAGISVEAVETTTATGPATVVRPIENEDMDDVAAEVVRKLGLSGFCGFDFVLEKGTRKPVLIELNPRPTPSCHLALNEQADLVGALYARLKGANARRVKEADPGTIAYFPQELWRDPSSRHLRNAFHDVPWENPDFVEMYFRPHRGDWPIQLALKVKDLWPASITGRPFFNFIAAKDR